MMRKIRAFKALILAALVAFMLAPIPAFALGANIISFQVKIAVTGTAVQFPNNALQSGLLCFAKGANAASIEFGSSTVTNTVDGTGNGAIVAAGGGWSLGVINSNVIYINGTANDIVTCWGN